ncbi:MAG: tetratricopeptide repeat protein [Desulfobacterales bacterium]|nr:MAG: tetratricopeptide repeat protein [Desulfobacterales bacterium]
MRQDEAATVATLKKQKETMALLIDKYRGRVVDSPGDNILAEFGSVVDAVECAVEISNELKNINEALPEDRKMEFRIGVHLGDVLEEEGRIYGDGVNIAARIEGLTESGGICISRTAYDSVKDKLSFGYEYLGEHRVKNIAEPVRVYRVLIELEAAGKVIGEKRFLGRISQKAAIAAIIILLIVSGGVIGWNIYLHQSKRIEPASLDKMAYPLPDKPSIAVLPFVNLSGDPDKEYLSEGLTEEIINALSKSPRFFVIARDSTFPYKGKADKIQQVAEALGVQYVLEGSVQWAGDRVRITVQLIDTLKGHQLFSERYDRELKDIFALQDEITMKVMSGMGSHAEWLGNRYVSSKGTKNLDAYLKWMQAAAYTQNFNKENAVIARRLAKESLTLDPEYADPYTVLAAANIIEVYVGASTSTRESLAQAEEMAGKALALDDSHVTAHMQLSIIYVFRRQFEKALIQAERAIAIAPNSAFANYMLGTAFLHSERFEEAIAYFKKSLRLNPIFPDSQCLNNLGSAYRFLGRYDEAIAAYKKLFQLYPDHLPGHANLAATYVMAGREEDARAEAAEVMRIDPKFSLERFARSFPYRKELIEELVYAWRKAGLE